MSKIFSENLLIVHVVHRFDTGGLENGVVNLINHMGPGRYRHAIVALTEFTEFRHRIFRADVECYALHKQAGQGFWKFAEFFRLIRKLRPAIVHTRNLAALEFQLPAWVAGVPVRIHSEHGRDVGDLDGLNKTNQWIRRFYKPFIHRFVALSEELSQYLTQKVGVLAAKVCIVHNGVDTEKFKCELDGQIQIDQCPFDPQIHFLIGTVGRMQTVKHQTLLASAFAILLQNTPELKGKLRLVMVGEGPLRVKVRQILDSAGLRDLSWLPGERADVAHVLKGLHVFALPSLAEGISNTILEAMATSLPVVATDVGGNAELIDNGHTGFVVPTDDAGQLATRLFELCTQPGVSRQMGLTGRQRVEAKFSMPFMINAYREIYDRELESAGFHVQKQS